MKKNDYKNTKVDWMVHAIVPDDKNKSNLKKSDVITFITCGFSKYGFGEIAVVGAYGNSEKIAGMINTVGQMLISGEEFSSDSIHVIDDENGNREYKFGVVHGVYPDSNEKFIQLIPQF